MSIVSWVLPPVNAGFLAGAALGTAVALVRDEKPVPGLLIALGAAWAAGSLYRRLR